MQKLERIQVKGFKSIREMDLAMRPLNILIGANGAGKSNFVEVFRFISHIRRGDIYFYTRKSGGADTILFRGLQHTDEIRLDLFFELGKYCAHLVSSDNDNLFEKEQSAEWKSSRLDEEADDALLGWRIYHFHNTSETAKIKLTQDLNDNAYLRPDGSNLAAYLYLLQKIHPHHYKRIEQTIQLVAPFFERFTLRPVPENTDTIMLEWAEKGWRDHLKAHYLSDGTLRFMALTTLLMQPVPPPLIIIDEPELGLHPFAIGLLAELLQSAAHDSQIIVTTQSAALVDLFSPEDIVVVEREDGASIFTRQSEESLQEWLEEYSLGEIWEKNIIGGRP